LATNVFLTDDASNCDSVLQHAVRRGSENVIKVLFKLRKPARKPTRKPKRKPKRGAWLCDIDDYNSIDETPLDCAAHAGQVHAARLLLRCNAHVDGSGDLEETPLRTAILKDDVRMARLLLDSKANVAYECCFYTPLHLAARHNRLRIIGALIDARADVNAASSRGRRTPLHTAAEYGHAQTVSAILCARGDATKCDMHGNTPLMLARSNDAKTRFAETIGVLARSNDAKTRFAETIGVLEALLAGK